MIGDSITAGWPPAPLAPWQIRNRGVPGNTARQIADRFDQALDDGSTVILMAGTNDVSINETFDFGPMFEMADLAAKAQVRLIVATIPAIGNADAAGGSEAVKRRGEAWNELIRNMNLFGAPEVKVADVYAAVNVPGAIRSDNVHLTQLGYELASKKLLEALEAK